MMKWATWAAGVLTLLGTTWGGFVMVDDRYAKAGEVQSQVSDLKKLYLRAEWRACSREKFELDVAKQKRVLTNLEQQRLAQLDQECKDLEAQARAIK